MLLSVVVVVVVVVVGAAHAAFVAALEITGGNAFPPSLALEAGIVFEEMTASGGGPVLSDILTRLK